MTKFAQVGFAQALERELRESRIKVGAICLAESKRSSRLAKGVDESNMLDPEDVAGVVLLACTQSPKSRIIEVQMRTMAESLA
jgi:NADP-dependent 3-hydroxy acid dehydrogenase YdfG